MPCLSWPFTPCTLRAIWVLTGECLWTQATIWLYHPGQTDLCGKSPESHPQRVKSVERIRSPSTTLVMANQQPRTPYRQMSGPIAEWRLARWHGLSSLLLHHNCMICSSLRVCGQVLECCKLQGAVGLNKGWVALEAPWQDTSLIVSDNTPYPTMTT